MKIVFLMTRVFLFILPFQVALSPVPGIDLPYTRLLAPLLVVSCLVAGLSEKRMRVPFSAVAAFLLSFLFLSILSVLWASDQPRALRRASFLLTYLPLFVVYATVFGEYPERLLGLFRPLVIGAGMAAGIGIIEFLSQFIFGVPSIFRFWTSSVLPIVLGSSFAASVAQYPSLLVNVGGATVLRASAFFPDPHMAAFFFGLVFPFAALLFFEERTFGRKVGFGFIAFLILVADVLTFSRGGYVGLAFGALSVLAGYARVDETFRRRVVMPIVLASFLIGSIALFGPVRERVFSVFSMDDGSNSGRMEIYSVAVRKIAEAPWGYGLANYPLAVKPTAEFREPIYAHDLYLDIATESGVIGAMSFLLVGVFAFGSLRRSEAPAALAASVSLWIFFGHSLFETPLYSVHILPVLLFVLALSSSLATSKRRLVHGESETIADNRRL